LWYNIEIRNIISTSDSVCVTARNIIKSDYNSKEVAKEVLMKPGFILNCHDREQNPLFESHDPSMMWDPNSGCYYSYSTDSAITSPYRQGIPIRKSSDLINFSFTGYALSQEAVSQGRDNGSYPPTRGFWAPFAEYYAGEYRLYYSATKAFGSSESRIWLAVSRHPEGPFENRGVVMDTWQTPDTEPNAIDPHIIDDSCGKKYLVYGSFFGGIFLKELDAATGLSQKGDTRSQGTCLAKKPAWSPIDGPEGAAVMYQKENGYFYLFLSYGWLGDDYDIRVGRSRSVLGPYLDFHGKDLKGDSLGLKLAGSYRFSAACPYAHPGNGWTFGGFRGPGHGVPFHDPASGSYYFVHHVRDGAPTLRKKEKRPFSRDTYLMHYMAVRKMYFTADGWPVLSPEPYAGEAENTQSLREWEMLHPNQEADWEWLRFLTYNSRQALSEKGALPKDIDRDSSLVFSCYDFENSAEAYGLSGLTKNGEAIWGKLSSCS